MAGDTGTNAGKINLLLQIKANIEEQLSAMAERATTIAKEHFARVGDKAGERLAKGVSVGFNKSIEKQKLNIQNLEKQLEKTSSKINEMFGEKERDYQGLFPDNESMYAAIDKALSKNKEYTKALADEQKLISKLEQRRKKLQIDTSAAKLRAIEKEKRASERLAQAQERAAERARKAEERARLAAEKAREKKLKKATKGFRSLGRNIRRSFKSVFLMTAVYAAFKTLRTLLSSATQDSQKFTNSLNTVKANLLGAFTPIVSAVMPMLERLMAGIASVTTKITSFMAAVFGKTYRQVMAKTKKLQSTAGGDKGGSLASFDEINQLSSQNSGTGGIDFSAIDTKGNETATKLGEKFKNAFAKIKEFLTPVKRSLTGMFDNAIRSFDSFVSAVIPGMTALWETVFLPVLTWIRDTFANVFAFISQTLADAATFFSENSATITKALEKIGIFANILWTDYINPLLNTLVSKVGRVVSWLFDTLGSFTQFLLGVFTADTDLALKGVFSLFENFYKLSAALFNGLKKLFDGVVNHLGTAIKEGFKIALGSIVALFAKAYNSVVSAVESMANAMIGAINGVIGRIKSSNIGNWVSGVLNINEMPPVSLTRMPVPQFASGAEITQPTLGLMGEYAGAYSNPEIVAPQSIMLETFMRAVTPLVESIRRLIESTATGQEIHIHLDGSLSAFARIFTPYLDDEAKRKGVKLIIES